MTACPPSRLAPPTRRVRRLVQAAALACALLPAAWLQTAQAGSDDHELARQALQQGKILPLRTVMDRVEEQYRGQVIKVEFERDDGLFVYDIRLLQNDGKLVKLKLDARDGSLISMKRKN